ncbi:MAG TPA: transketolase, partial [Streptosporangiaceae bacterium]
MTSPQSTAGINLGTAAELAAQLRADSIRYTTSAGSGHPTSSMSAADILAVLAGRHLRYDWDNPADARNDHLIFSKGHASPLLYSVFRAAGVVSDEELLADYRRFGSRLEGHPTPILPWVDVATGSLGQGLPDGVGIALAGKYLDGLPYRTWVLCGDSEMAEGSIWEALDKAAYYGLSNLIAIIDVNRLGQRGPMELQWDMAAYRHRVEAFGARAIEVDGHDLAAIDEALGAASDGSSGRPAVILARTIKGRGFAEVEDQNGWHGKAFPAEMAGRAIAGLGGIRNLTVRGPRPDEAPHAPLPAVPGIPGLPGTSMPQTAMSQGPVAWPGYALGEQVATRKAYGEALAALGAADQRVVVLDGEVSNSTHADKFAYAHPSRYFEMFIAEQQLIAAAVGLSVRQYVPFASTFAAFLTRGHDFIRMASISAASIRLCGSHCGVEIGADGPSQMALEDLAMMRAVYGSAVLYPSDATSAAALVRVMADRPGISYLRTTRGGYPVLYQATEEFRVGGSKVLRSTSGDAVTLVEAGVTVHACLAAAGALAADGIAARVIDLYSVKPVDTATLRAAAEVTGGR